MWSFHYCKTKKNCGDWLYNNIHKHCGPVTLEMGKMAIHLIRFWQFWKLHLQCEHTSLCSSIAFNMHIFIHEHNCTCTCMYTNVCTHAFLSCNLCMHSHMSMQTLMYTHIHTQIHKHTFIHSNSVNKLFSHKFHSLYRKRTFCTKQSEGSPWEASEQRLMSVL